MVFAGAPLVLSRTDKLVIGLVLLTVFVVWWFIVGTLVWGISRSRHAWWFGPLAFWAAAVGLWASDAHFLGGIFGGYVASGAAGFALAAAQSRRQRYGGPSPG